MDIHDKTKLMYLLFEKTGWNASLWAKKTGISLNQVSRWKRGLTKNIRPVNLEILARAAGYTIEWTNEMHTEGKLASLDKSIYSNDNGGKMINTETGYLLYFNHGLSRPERIYIKTMTVEYYDYNTGEWTGASNTTSEDHL